mmetsp:Transcript_13794/g.43670  ORF Transcript_13794/g.43670 Transcript_13794/m.43670 type:complete len:227 (+) Transcript_13794:729-1409(+)
MVQHLFAHGLELEWRGRRRRRHRRRGREAHPHQEPLLLPQRMGVLGGGGAELGEGFGLRGDLILEGRNGAERLLRVFARLTALAGEAVQLALRLHQLGFHPRHLVRQVHLVQEEPRKQEEEGQGRHGGRPVRRPLPVTSHGCEGVVCRPLPSALCSGVGQPRGGMRIGISGARSKFAMTSCPKLVSSSVRGRLGGGRCCWGTRGVPWMVLTTRRPRACLCSGGSRR